MCKWHLHNYRRCIFYKHDLKNEIVFVLHRQALPAPTHRVHLSGISRRQPQPYLSIENNNLGIRFG